MGNPELSRLEQELTRVPGVKSARVRGDGAPSEIHIVATQERSPKQLVRDVQSLASAGFGMPIDHRIVSVVQLEEDPIRVVTDPMPAPRPVLERVILASRAGAAWIKVVLDWPDGTTTEGLSTAERTREARARAAVDAVLRAIKPVLDKRHATVEMHQVHIHQVGNQESVLTQGTYSGDGSTIQISGSALVHDDVSTAAVHSALHALNRKLA